LFRLRPGYSWQSPFRLDRDPTGQPKACYASPVHDALDQFLPDGLPLTRAQADRCFLLPMTESVFAPRHIYYLAVRALGWLTLPVTRRMRATYDGWRLDLTAMAEEAGA
jgi:hypothetical protein